jgi:hypothetical protein
MQRRTLFRVRRRLEGLSVFSRKGAFASAADSRIEVLLGEPLGTISPAIYGHFTEMLAAVVYEGTGGCFADSLGLGRRDRGTGQTARTGSVLEGRARSGIRSLD